MSMSHRLRLTLTHAHDSHPLPHGNAATWHGARCLAARERGRRMAAYGAVPRSGLPAPTPRRFVPRPCSRGWSPDNVASSATHQHSVPAPSAPIG